MIFHVLPGDAYVETFRETGLDGELVVCRECLIGGEVKADGLQEFWKVREQFLSITYPESSNDYYTDVVAEFEKLIDLPEDSEVNLWFEYELFCQANMWFCIDLLRNSNAKIYRVEPSVVNKNNIWKGFGELNADEFAACFDFRVKFSDADISLGSDLWNAYKNDDYANLKNLSRIQSPCFPHLKAVCEAAIEKDTRPKSILKDITGNGEKDFDQIFSEFSKRAGVYGFGDAQVKRVLQSY